MAHAHYFDVVIIGDGIGGLYAGLLLARAGARIAIIGRDKTLPADDPFLDTVLRVRPYQKTPSLFSHLLEAAKANQGTANLFVKRSPGFQLLGPDLRLDIVAGEEGQKEVQRERPNLLEDLDAWQQCIDQCGFGLDSTLAEVPLPPRGFFENRSMKKVLAKISPTLPNAFLEDSEIAFLLQSISLSSLRTTLTEDINAPALRAISRWRDGDTLLSNGREGLVTHLASLCERHGAQVALDASVTEIGLKGWKIEEIAHTAGKPYGCGSLIVSQNASRLLPLLPEGKKAYRAIQKYAEQTQVENLVIGLRLTLPLRAFPSALRDRAVFMPKEPVVEGASAITLALEPAVEENRILTAALAVPGNLESPADFCMDVSKTLLLRLEEILPFLRENALLEEESTAEVLQSYAYSSKEPEMFGAGGFDPKTPFSNAWLVSRQVLPGLGIEGELLTGRRIASWIHKGVVQPDMGAFARTVKRA